MSNTTMDKYAKMLETNRLRQKRFYEKNKNRISDKRKEKRDEINRIYKEYKKIKKIIMIMLFKMMIIMLFKMMIIIMMKLMKKKK